MGKAFVIILIFFLLVSSVPANEMAVPVDIQFRLFLKIIACDRDLESRFGDEIKIGIVYQSKFRASLDVKNRLIEVMQESPIKDIEGIPINYIPIDLGGVSTLASSISNAGVDILYITPLRALDVKQISDISRENRITTLTGIPEYVKDGLAVGISSKGEKPLIIINLEAAKTEGAKFSSQLLKLAEIIEGY
ncbi:MAG: YfiR family protein [candidate division Zixibacteria bacterium]|nr:YfiR family protein [candidate division Zixibacteria bacterium]